MEFHHLVEKILFANKKARPDICKKISCINTKVREPDNEDWAKLVHQMKYIRGSRKLSLILSVNKSVILKYFIGWSLVVHPKTRKQTGCLLSMRRAFPIVSSTKQNLNTQSSTKIEVVSVDDYMTYVLWNRYWLDAQGYNIFENIVYQDNNIDIILGKNRKASSRKRMKHINTIYYLVKYCIAQY